jgi:hypothetical protein
MRSMQIQELRSVSFDTAVEKKVYIGDTKSDAEKDDQRKAIWNVQRNKTASIVCKNYNLLQHSDVVGSVVDAMTNLNLKAEARVSDMHNRIFVDISFPEAQIKLNIVGEEFMSGIRIVNSYDKTTGIMVIPYLKRLVCSNGMVMNVNWVKSLNVKHTSKLTQDFESVAQRLIHDMISSSDKLQAMVSDCIGDSIEWEIMDRILQKLDRKKHIKAITTELIQTCGKQKSYSRWQLYNAFTSYATHGLQLKPSVENWLQTQAQKILVTPLEKLVPVEVKTK